MALDTTIISPGGSAPRSARRSIADRREKFRIAELRARIDEFAATYQSGTQDGAAVLAEAIELFALAEQSNDPYCLGKSGFLLGACSSSHGDYDRAMKVLTVARGAWAALADRPNEARSLKLLGDCFHKISRASESLEYLQKALDIAVDIGADKLIADINMSIGMSKLVLGDSTAALSVMLDGVARLERLGAHVELLNARIYVATVYMHMRDDHRTIAEYQEALLLARQLDLRLREASILGEMGLAYKRLRIFDEALERFRQSRAILERVDDRSYLPRLLCYFAMVYDQLTDYTVANEYLHEALRLADPKGDGRAYAMCLIALGNNASRRGASGEAIEWLLKARDESEGLDIPWEIRLIHVNLAECYQQIGEFALALREFRTYVAINEDLIGEQQRAKFRELQRSLDDAREKAKLSLQQERSERLRRQAEESAKELTALALQLVRKNKFLDQVQRQLASAAKLAEPAQRRRLRALIRDIQHQRSGGDQWLLFEEQFRRVHPTFHTTLRERRRPLTVTELNVSALITIGLSSKEIADVLCVSLRSVETYRLRVRKKLDLPDNANLMAYLVSL